MIGLDGTLLDTLLLLLLIVVAISMVVLVAWLGRLLLRSRPPGQPSAEMTRGPDGPLEIPEPPSREPTGATVPPYLVGLRSDGTGGWTIHIAGKTYSALDTVPDAATRDQVVAALRALVDFSRGYIQRTRTDATSATARVAAPPSQASPPRTVSARSVERIPGVALPGEAPIRREAVRGATMPTIDLAKEIGDIVEEMLDQSPALRSHSIRLQNVPGQGVAFVVDGIRYGELNDIPDPKVQTLIREATKEWERR